jgi:hypothetical protein
MEMTINADIPPETIANFTAACNRYRSELGNSLMVAMRRGVIALVKSIRARTPVAPKLLPKNHVRRAGASETYSYYTPKGSKKSFPRFAIIRRNGKPTYYRPDRLSDTYAVIRTEAAARKKWGEISQWGLGRKSWGWFMQSLFHRANPDANHNPKAKIKKGMVDASPLREIVTGPNRRVEVTLWNKLEYMKKILPDGAIAKAMQSATASINKQLDIGAAKARKELE